MTARQQLIQSLIAKRLERKGVRMGTVEDFVSYMAEPECTIQPYQGNPADCKLPFNPSFGHSTTHGTLRCVAPNEWRSEPRIPASLIIAGIAGVVVLLGLVELLVEAAQR